MAKVDKKSLSMRECDEVAQRLADGFEEAVGDTKAKLSATTRLLVGIRGALSEVRDDTNAGWIVETIGRALAHLGVTEEDEE